MKLIRLTKDTKPEIVSEFSYRDQEIGGFGEATLQDLLIDYPEVIPAEEINTEEPPKFLVIRSEAGVTAGSMDILYIDHKGIPTVVEAKLVDNREIRRSVLAQGLEYLSYLKSEWAPERILEEGNAFWKERGTDIEQEAQKRFGFPLDEEFMEKVMLNIQANRMRLVIASDKIPPELRKMIEFLNEASAFDIFGLEVRLFVSGDNSYRILAPQLVGISQTTKERKQRGPLTRWDYSRFFEVLEKNYPDVIGIAQELYSFGREVTDRDVEWGIGRETGSFTARLVIGKERFSLFSVYTSGQLSINFGWNRDRVQKIGIPEISEKYRNRVNEELGLEISQRKWEGGWAMADLSLLLDKKESFMKIINDFKREVVMALK